MSDTRALFFLLYIALRISLVQYRIEERGFLISWLIISIKRSYYYLRARASYAIYICDSLAFFSSIISTIVQINPALSPRLKRCTLTLSSGLNVAIYHIQFRL
jgi:hypothetical protein